MKLLKNFIQRMTQFSNIPADGNDWNNELLSRIVALFSEFVAFLFFTNDSLATISSGGGLRIEHFVQFEEFRYKT